MFGLFYLFGRVKVKQMNNFVPSDKLIDYFVSGINEAIRLTKEASKKDKTMLKELNRYELKPTTDLAAMLQQDIAGIITMVASRGRSRDYKELSISENGKFIPGLQHEISINFIIRPEDMPDFIQSLHNELVKHMENNGNFDAAWGHMELNHMGLVLLLNGDSTPVYPPKVKATLIK